MGLMWQFAEVSKRPYWKAMTWAMVRPLHAPATALLITPQAFMHGSGQALCEPLARATYTESIESTGCECEPRNVQF